jgi:hypothetical protein
MMETDRRQMLFQAIGGAAVIPLLAVPAVAADGKGTQPAQAWAHKSGRITMRVPSAVTARADPMDYLLIQEALGRYGMAHDELRFDVLAELFTADALLEVAKGSGTPFQKVTGGNAIVANFANVLSQQRDQRRHCFTNMLVEALTHDRASLLAYGLVSVAADGLTLGATVFYQADLVKSAGHWRFTRLFIGMDDYTTPAPKL